MRTYYLTLIVSIMFFKVSAQSDVFDKNFVKKKIIDEEVVIEFENDGVTIPDMEGVQAAFLLSLLPTAVDMGIKFAGDQLKKWEQSFTGEYDHTQSNLKIGVAKIPSLTFRRNIKTEKSSQFEQAVSLEFKANALEDFSGGMYYSLEKLKIDYSKARITSKKSKLNYTINLKLSFLVLNKDGSAEKKEIELNPINVPYVEVGKEKSILGNKYTSDIIMMPSGGRLAEVGVKIVESNPAKVRAEKISKLFQDNRDDIKTVINNFLPKAEESKDEDDDNDGDNGNPNESTGN